MELLNYEITFEHLIILVAILYILMFIIKRKEGFETEEVELLKKWGRPSTIPYPWGSTPEVATKPTNLSGSIKQEQELKNKQEQELKNKQELQLKNIIQQKTKACREESIDQGFLHYTFNSPAVPRR
jgi:predicted Holliday junction resolvase-like endonuclease